MTVKVKTDIERYRKEAIKFNNICPKSYYGKHIWRTGYVYNPVKILGVTFSTLFIEKPVLEVNICHACGIVKEK